MCKTLSKSPKLREKYDTIIEDQFKKRVVEELNKNCEQREKRSYSSHHAVITPDKETSKHRIV